MMHTRNGMWRRTWISFFFQMFSIKVERGPKPPSSTAPPARSQGPVARSERGWLCERERDARRKWITGSAITRIEKMHACMHPRWHLFFYRICTRPWALLDTLRTRVDRSTGFHWEGSQGKKCLSSSKLTNEFLTLPPPPIIQEWLVLIHIILFFWLLLSILPGFAGCINIYGFMCIIRYTFVLYIQPCIL